MGAVIVTVAAISTAEVVHAFRFLNLPFALWLVIAPWVLRAHLWISVRPVRLSGEDQFPKMRHVRYKVTDKLTAPL